MSDRPGTRVRIFGWEGDATHLGFDEGFIAAHSRDDDLVLVADVLGQESAWLPSGLLEVVDAE